MEVGDDTRPCASGGVVRLVNYQKLKEIPWQQV
jgi:hypothetical protein